MPEKSVSITPVGRFTFSSQNEDEVAEFIRRMYVDSRSGFLKIHNQARFSASVASAGDIGTDQIRSTVDYAAKAQPFDYFLSVALHHGAMRIRSRHKDTLVKPGNATLFPIGTPLNVDLLDMGALRIVRLPLDRLQQVAEDNTGVTAAHLSFQGVTPVSEAMGRYWMSVINLVWNTMTTDPSPMGTPLLVEDMTRFAAAAALQTFPNTVMTQPYVPGPGQVAPAALRRAAAYIEANADLPLRLADIAAAAGTGGRALQYGFRQHYDTTPLGYLRRVRIQHAHRELQAADPTGGDSVAAIAARWGFSKPSTFAAVYRQIYGVLPSHTLRA